uniref:rhodanese-like domain-containing protein n=1 Tax=uncultured Campylobacter sp. TaxID=218934 RepID=UPI00262130E0
MKFISHKILKSAVLLAALGSFATCSAEMQQPNGYAISGAALSAIEEDNRAKENYLVIDVRSADEYAAGHLKHAINIPLEQLESRLDEINAYKDKNVVLYCNTGNRSSKALDLLKQKGFSMLMNAPGVKQYDYELYKVGSINAEGFLKIANEPNV